MFNLTKLNEVESKEKYRCGVSNGVAALEDLDCKVDINNSCETIKENAKISAKESLGHYEL
jgi:hypothetical protein